MRVNLFLSHAFTLSLRPQTSSSRPLAFQPLALLSTAVRRLVFRHLALPPLSLRPLAVLL